MPFRTDLAMEMIGDRDENLPRGIRQNERKFGNITINTVEITDDESAQLIGKPIGKYITALAPPFYGAIEITEEEINAIAEEIAEFLPSDGLVLAVGLGNNDITPDAIGPRTVRQILSTRHISGDMARDAGLEGIRATAALAPGVLGQTGIETSEIISSIVRDIKPNAVIVIDALAARDASRLGSTIQISNTGISPGSGVQNSRKELSEHTIGVPVISIGVPTVVDAATLVEDLLEGHEDMEELLEYLRPGGNTMMITPREIDVLIGHACKTLSLAINKALHPSMTLEEIAYLTS